MNVIETSDFAIFWKIGHAILSGLSPYSIGESWYPPAGSMIFALTALLPLGIGYFIMLGLNALAALSIIRHYGKLWLAYIPLIFVMLAGQVDLILVAFIPWLNEKGWKNVAAAIILSLKPITAIVVLPWFMVRWAINDRQTLLRTLSLGGIVHIAPLIFRPTILSEWVDAILSSGVGHYTGGVGIWLITGIPTWTLLLITVIIAFLALKSANENMSRALLMMASPFAMPYHLIMLIGTAPANIVVPVSILSTIILSMTFIQPYRMLIPLTIIIFHLMPKHLTIPAPTGSIRLYGGGDADHH